MAVTRLRVALLLALATTLLFAGCGGSDGKDLKEVRACLKDAGFKLKGLQPGDRERVDDGVSGLYKSKDGELVLATAVIAKSDDDVDKLERAAADFDRDMNEEREGGHYESGTDGRYVWGYGGTSEADQHDDGKACVKP